MTEIEELCKRAYEKVIMDSIVEDDTSFIHQEVSDSSFVQIIRIVESESCSDLYHIYTEKGVGAQSLDVDNSEHTKEIVSLLDKYNATELYIEDGVREWYDDYLVPRIKKAFRVMEL